MCADWHDVVVAVGGWVRALGLDCAEDCPRCDGVVWILEGQERARRGAEDLQAGMPDLLGHLASYSQGLAWAGRRPVESEALGHVKSERVGWLTTSARRGL